MMINYDNNNSYVLIMHHWAFITIVALDYIINDQLLLTLINNSHIGSHYVPGHWCVRPIFLITTMWGDTVIIPILQMDKLLCLLIALHSIKNMAGTLCQLGLLSSSKAPSCSLTFIHQVHIELLLCATYCSGQWRGRAHTMFELFSTWLTPTHLLEPLCFFSPTKPFLNLPAESRASFDATWILYLFYPNT